MTNSEEQIVSKSEGTGENGSGGIFNNAFTGSIDNLVSYLSIFMQCHPSVRVFTLVVNPL